MSTDSFKIKVPITLEPPHLTFLENSAPISFTVGGAGTTYTWDILSESTMAIVATPADYGTWGKASPVADDATNTFAPADVTEVKTFYIQITIEGDPDLTPDNGLNNNVFGPFRIVPVAAYMVNVKKADGTALDGATVTVNYAGQAPVTTSADGKAVFNLPDTGGTYAYEALLAGYVSKSASSTDKTVDVTLPVVDKTITGTVQGGSPAAPIAEATVTAYIPTALATQYKATTAASPAFVYDVKLTSDAAGTVPLAAADIKRIIITIPLDLSVVKPGDMEKGV